VTECPFRVMYIRLSTPHCGVIPGCRCHISPLPLSVATSASLGSVCLHSGRNPTSHKTGKQLSSSAYMFYSRGMILRQKMVTFSSVLYARGWECSGHPWFVRNFFVCFRSSCPYRHVGRSIPHVFICAPWDTPRERCLSKLGHWYSGWFPVKGERACSVTMYSTAKGVVVP